METRAMSTDATHEVDNQPPEFAPRDLWHDDVALREAVAREGGDAFADRLARYGALAGDALYAAGFDANRDRPRLRTHDRFGHRIDRVEFHPAYHQLMEAAIGQGVAGLSWAQPVPGAHVARAALAYLHHQADAGTSCPLTMTHAAVPVLRRAPHLRAWADKVATMRYDARDVPIDDKVGVTLGMGMTEKQGGSDVRSNSTRATPTREEGAYTLRGHKWFFSAPMSDGFLVLAQAEAGPTCFLMPRRRPGGERNDFRLMRLKDKLGDWSNASAEIEFDRAWALRVGEAGRGVATILEMVMLTRLDCMLAAAAQMRMALAQALHHTRHRRAFGRVLAEQPLMRNVLADLAIEAEAAVALALRVAGAVDAAGRDPAQAAFARVATAIGKYWLCRRAPAVVNEAQECLGGAGYIEESILPRLYRQAPLNSIWEGSGNLQCLDVLRALTREPGVAAALQAQIEGARGMHAAFDAAADRLADQLADVARAPQDAEPQARRLVEATALVLQGAVLLRANSPIAATFCASRLACAHALALGTLERGIDLDAPLARVLPA
ncbi:acyl-CoA dehydrogenase family protein [Luteimonas sp. RC10]|uniref:acyl-CoA dehydrogenase family protein n=1 Tax=Luteimonas sp. RC10 TaxID=2587035 RepID=UPI0016077832|nr:acyl-CoA dehydrogenase family protein [Luteimonas sp. RC10]